MTDLTDHELAELAELAAIAEDTHHSPADRAHALLVVHQRRNVGGCLCGWIEPGRSHAKHQASELAHAGLLAAANPATLADEEIS